MDVGVAIVDSGVHPRHPHVTGLVAGRCFVPGEPGERYLDYLGHGTAVAGAICEKGAPVRLYVAKIFHERLVTSIDVVLAGIDWALEQPVALVNLSLGTPNEAHRERLAERVARAAERGIRIVAPGESLPGCLPGVVGVRLDESRGREGYTEGFGASGWPRPIPGRAVEENLYGISFAVANVTGWLARDMAEAGAR